MRVDKYLWCVRYYKTRNMVTEACKKNHITVNGQVSKASKEVFPSDKITFRKFRILWIHIIFRYSLNYRYRSYLFIKVLLFTIEKDFSNFD